MFSIKLSEHVTLIINKNQPDPETDVQIPE